MGHRKYNFVAAKYSCQQQDQLVGHTAYIPEEVPDSQGFRVAQLLATQLDYQCELQHSLTWLYGRHMADLPRRLVYHDALRDSVATLLQIFQAVHSSPYEHDEAPLRRSYIRAIQSVRQMLDNDPKAGYGSETLCAVTLLSSCSPFFEGAKSVFANAHASGAIEMLKARKFSCDADPFDSAILTMLRDATAIKAIIDGRTGGLTEEDWDALEKCYVGKDPTTRLLRCSVQIGRLFARAQYTDPGSDEEASAFEEGVKLQRKLEVLTLEFSDLAYRTEASVYPTRAVQTQHAQYLRTYSLTLTIGGQLLTMLIAIAPENKHFGNEQLILKYRVLSLAEKTGNYRPWGATWVIISLMGCWCATMGTAHQDEVAKVLDELQHLQHKDGSWSMGFPRYLLYKLFYSVCLQRGPHFGTTPPPTEGFEEANNLLFFPARTALY